MYQMIQSVGLPEWIKYLTKKNSDEKQANKPIPRKDALWKRVLRDIRSLYRILFRNRFYSYNYRNKHYQDEWVKIFLKELNLPLPEDHSEYKHVFTFIHQTHRLKQDGHPMNRYDEIFENPFCAIDCYNTKTREKLVSHPISSRMIYMVVHNYSEVFQQLINETIKKEYMECIDSLKESEFER